MGRFGKAVFDYPRNPCDLWRMAKDPANTKAIWVDVGKDGKVSVSVDPARLDRGELLGFATACHIEDAGDYLDLTFFDEVSKAAIARWVVSTANIARTLWPAIAEFYNSLIEHSQKNNWKPRPTSDKRPSEPIIPIRVDLLLLARGGLFVEIEAHWIHGWSQFIVSKRRQGDILSKPAGTIQLHVALAFAILTVMKKKAETPTAGSIEET